MSCITPLHNLSVVPSSKFAKTDHFSSMADSILFNVAANVITKLGSSALRELGSLWGVNDELGKLQNILSAIKAVLLDAEEQQSVSHAVKDWISKLRDVFYDVDDLIDEFSYETLRRQVLTKDRTITKQVCIFFSKSNQVSFGHKMSQKIKQVREKLDAIANDKTQLHLSVRMRETRDDELRKMRETCSFIPKGEVIGRDDDKKAIIDFLLDTNTMEDNVEVVSIVGMGGLGKTAVAQSVYNDEKINEHFKLKLWVCISQEFDIKVIVEKIIEFIAKKKPDSLQLDILQSMLQEKIDGKKYLLVMDDVWNESHETWVSLKRFLMGGAKGSRILITTRNLQVAQASDTVQFHHLKELDNESSWALFRKMAFLNEEEEIENSNKVRIGKEIIAKLKGSPLTIRIVGRLLYFKNTEMDWLSFKDNDLGTILQQENQIQPILKISFNHLPSNLKHCFTYCALFPKDYEFQKDGLVKQWMAQGFIQSHSNKEIEDVGDDYFKELLGRSFFHNVKVNKWGDVKECKMHDLIHDLACWIVENECVDASDKTKSIDKRTRHVSFPSNYSRKSWELEAKSLTEVKNLRTLHGPPFLLSENHLRLRSLNLGYSKFQKIPKFISQLRHLRYLDISDHDMKFLPKFITKLYNLETLILRHCSDLRELPTDINNLINLKHLDVHGCYRLTHMPKGLGGLTSLQTMNLFVLGKDKGCDLSELNELARLRGSLLIKGLELCTTTDLKNAKYMEEKFGIQKLKLRWNRDLYDAETDYASENDDERVLDCLKPHSNVHKMQIRGYRGVKLCNWLSFDYLGGLVNIELQSCEKLQHLPQFDQFPFLKHLLLENLPSIEYIDNNNSLSSSTFFPSLEKLTIMTMPNLKGWWKGETPPESARYSALFPTILHHLSRLDISNCPQLASIPQHPPLRSLALNDVSVQLFDMVIKMATTPAADSSSALSKLSILHIQNIDLEFLPEELFGSTTDLEIFTVVNCKNLQMSSSHLVDEDNDGVLGKKLGNLHSLGIFDMPQLEYLWKELKYMTTLERLDLYNCPNIVSLEGISHLTSLSSLRICNCSNLTSLPEGISHLTSLSYLTIVCCPNLTSLPAGIGHLTSLSTLLIKYCVNLTSLPEGVSHLTSLSSFTIEECPCLTSLPEGVSHLTSLSTLIIRRCVNLTSLPEGIGHLTSLSIFTIEECLNLTSLPEGLLHLSSLRGSLTVSKCPKLSKTWKKLNK